MATKEAIALRRHAAEARIQAAADGLCAARGRAAVDLSGKSLPVSVVHGAELASVQQLERVADFLEDLAGTPQPTA